jgi:natural product precursor
MKKQTKKLSLNKKTISNLSSSEMHRAIGGWGIFRMEALVIFFGQKFQALDYWQSDDRRYQI